MAVIAHIEREALQRKLVQGMLESCGHEVFGAVDPKTVDQQLTAAGYDKPDLYIVEPCSNSGLDEQTIGFLHEKIRNNSASNVLIAAFEREWKDVLEHNPDLTARFNVFYKPVSAPAEFRAKVISALHRPNGKQFTVVAGGLKTA